MTDFQFLLLAVAGLYLSECILWVRRGSVVFRAMFGGRFGVAHPSPGLGSTGAGMVFLNFMPPLGTAFICHQWPLSVSAEGVVSFVPEVINSNERPEQLGHYVGFAEIAKISRDEGTILVNDVAFAKLNGEIQARYFVELLTRLQGMAEGERGEAIEAALEKAMNPALVRRRVRRFRREARWMLLQSHVVMVLLGAVLATVGIPLIRAWLLTALVSLLFMVMVTATTFFEAHRRLFAAARGTRWKKTLTMFLTPTVAIRARDTLSRDVLAEFHPLAAAVVLCGEEERRRFLRRVLLDMEHPMQPMYPSEDGPLRAVVDAFHARLKGAAERLLVRVGEDMAGLMAPPGADDASCKAYCPRCDGQFVVTEGTCSHCGDLAIRVLPGAVGAGGIENGK